MGLWKEMIVPSYEKKDEAIKMVSSVQGYTNPKGITFVLASVDKEEILIAIKDGEIARRFEGEAIDKFKVQSSHPLFTKNKYRTMSLMKNKAAAEKWLLNQCGSNVVQKTAIVVVKHEDVLKVNSEKQAKELAISDDCHAFKMLYRCGQVESTVIQSTTYSISELIERLADNSKQPTKADLARARGKSQVHSSTQFPAFVKYAEDVESAFENLGYKIVLYKKV